MDMRVSQLQSVRMLHCQQVMHLSCCWATRLRGQPTVQGVQTCMQPKRSSCQLVTGARTAKAVKHYWCQHPKPPTFSGAVRSTPPFMLVDGLVLRAEQLFPYSCSSPAARLARTPSTSRPITSRRASLKKDATAAGVSYTLPMPLFGKVASTCGGRVHGQVQRTYSVQQDAARGGTVQRMSS